MVGCTRSRTFESACHDSGPARATHLGMIGSRRKVALIRKNFLESGLATEAEFDCVLRAHRHGNAAR